MWSDPPVNPEDFLCFGFCTDMGIKYLGRLLDDPANDDRSFGELMDRVSEHQLMEYFRPRLTPAALETFPLNQLDDPGYRNCELWGLARQMFAPHQLEFRRFPDRVEMRYGEWEARRTVYLDGHAPPANPQPTLMGYSVGRFEGDTLVIESSGIRANITHWRAKHSDQLKITERYSRDGDRLVMTATFEDPWALKEPLHLKKIWSWAPDQRIFPYVNCERPNETSLGGDQR